MTRRVVPRDAAALVITRAGPGGFSVLLGQRHGGHAFMPLVVAEVAKRLEAPDPCALPVPFARYTRGGVRVDRIRG